MHSLYNGRRLGKKNIGEYSFAKSITQYQGIVEWWRADQQTLFSASIFVGLTGSIAGLKLSASTGTTFPLLQSSSLVTFPYLRQSGTANSVLRTDPIGFMTGTNQLTVYLIGTVNTNLAQNFITTLPSNNNSWNILPGAGYISCSIRGNGGTELMYVSSSILTSSFYIMAQSFQFGSTGSNMGTFYLNGIALSGAFSGALANNTGSVFDTPLRLSIGGVSGFMEWSDLLIFNVAHTSKQKIDITNLLNALRKVF